MISFTTPAPPPRLVLASPSQSQGCQQQGQVMEQEVINTSPDFRELPSNLSFPGSCQEVFVLIKPNGPFGAHTE